MAPTTANRILVVAIEEVLRTGKDGRSCLESHPLPSIESGAKMSYRVREGKP
jgi:hypothetical protein